MVSELNGFSPGDRVVCVDTSNAEHELVFNRTYIVVETVDPDSWVVEGDMLKLFDTIAEQPVPSLWLESLFVREQ